MRDAVLREVGIALDRSVRQGIDGCYRLGGDEFAVLVPGAGSRHVLAALRRGFDRASKVLDGRISCSIGIVTCRDGEGLDDLVHRADRLMYEAKRGDTVEGDTHAFGRVDIGQRSSRHALEKSLNSLFSGDRADANGASSVL